MALAAQELQAKVRGFHARRQSRMLRTEKLAYNRQRAAAAKRIQRQRRENVIVRKSAIEQAEAAIRMQAMFRGQSGRRSMRLSIKGQSRKKLSVSKSRPLRTAQVKPLLDPNSATCHP